MKNTILIAIVALAVASCAKDRTCTCTNTPVSTTVNGVSQPTSGSPSTTVTKYTKAKKGETPCNSGESTITASFVSGGTAYNYVSVSKADCKLD